MPPGLTLATLNRLRGGSAVQDTASVRPGWVLAEREVLCRLEAVCTVLAALERGEWALDAQVAGALRRLLEQAARFATLTAALALAA
jgi:hypothetical protein